MPFSITDIKITSFINKSVVRGFLGCHPNYSKKLEGVPSMIYLYVKTHTITGLKYLGQTSSHDPYKYKGSGVYWRRHLRVHGPHFTTQILLASEDPNDIKETGMFFSGLWGIVDSREWANLMEEKGNGVDSSTARAVALKRVENGTHPLIARNRTYATNNNARDRKGMTYDEIYGSEKAKELREHRSACNKQRWKDEAFRRNTAANISQTRKEKIAKGEIPIPRKGKVCSIAKSRRDEIRQGFQVSGMSKTEYAKLLNISVITLRMYLRTTY
jgi:DNA-binding transcriptional regulator YiaG